MLLLAFKQLGRSSPLGPVEGIEFRGGELFSQESKVALARYSAGNWTYAGERWAYAECRTWILLRFEDLNGEVGPVVGPRLSLRLRDRFVFLGRERVASLVPHKGQWQVVGRDESWPILKVLSRQAPAGP